MKKFLLFCLVIAMTGFTTAVIGQGVAPEATPEVTMANVWQFDNTALASVDMHQVDYARGDFTSPWPSLSNVLGEDGKLVVGPEFPQSQIDASRGAIWRVNPGNQYRLQGDEMTLGCAEGSFIFVSVQEAVVSTTNLSFSFRAPDGSGTHLYIRCQNSDAHQGSDAGNDIRVSGYKADSGLVTHFSGSPAGGFVSSGGALQALEISQSGTSCGSEGCNYTYVITADSNTGAISVGRWDGTTMSEVFSNWYVAQ